MLLYLLFLTFYLVYKKTELLSFRNPLPFRNNSVPLTYFKALSHKLRKRLIPSSCMYIRLSPSARTLV